MACIYYTWLHNQFLSNMFKTFVFVTKVSQSRLVSATIWGQVKSGKDPLKEWSGQERGYLEIASWMLG